MGCFGRFWGAKPTLFLVFSVALPLREDVEVFGVTPHLLNVTGQGTRHLVAGTLDPLVQHHFILLSRG